VRANPETNIVEGAESLARSRRPHRLLNPPRQSGLPGAWAHIESPGEQGEQERPIGNRRVEAGAGERGETGALWG
jgi:hypothetical protein